MHIPVRMKAYYLFKWTCWGFSPSGCKNRALRSCSSGSSSWSGVGTRFIGSVADEGTRALSREVCPSGRGRHLWKGAETWSPRREAPSTNRSTDPEGRALQFAQIWVNMCQQPLSSYGFPGRLATGMYLFPSSLRQTFPLDQLWPLVHS